MSANAYELLALSMRYVFIALMLLIVIRAWRITMVDRRRAARLRKLSPDTGIIGEMLVVNGGERARPGMHYPLTLEGSVGSGRRCDVRVRHSSVRSRHAIFQMTDEGLFVRSHAQARIRDGHGRAARELLLQDGDILRLGDVALMLVLTDAGSAPEEISRRIRRRHSDERMRRADAPVSDAMDAMDEDLFQPQPDADDLFRSNPAARSDFPSAEDPYDAYDAYDRYDAYDAYDDDEGGGF